MAGEQGRREARFDDILQLTDAEFQRLLREVDTRDLAVCLKGASPELSARVFANLSERVGTMVRQEMEFLGHVPAETVAEVKGRVVETVLALASRGHLRIPRQDGTPGPEAHPGQALTFSDIDLLTDEEIRLLLQRVDARDLALALEDGFWIGLQYRILSLAPEASRQVIQMDEGEGARNRIEQTLRAMVGSGEIAYPQAAKELEASQARDEEDRYRLQFQERMGRVDRLGRAGSRPDVSLLAGLGLGILMVAWGIGMGRGLLRPVPSALFVLVGTLAVVTTAQGFGGLRSGLRMAAGLLRWRSAPVTALIEALVAFADRARREGILSLEEVLARVSEPFFQAGMKLAVDGVEPTVVQKVLEGEVSALRERHREGQTVVATAGIGGALFGGLGTLLGLVMLAGRAPAGTGSGIGAAFVTLLWGGILWGICYALRARLRQMTAWEVLQRRIVMVGIFEIQSGTNPVMLEAQLVGLISPREWKAHVEWRQGR